MKDPRVDTYLQNNPTWAEASSRLRALLLASGLAEDIKWGKPCYTLDDANVAIIQDFKAYCALMFFKGALLADPAKLLHSPGANSQAARQLRFTSAAEVDAAARTVKTYLKAAIELERAGLKVEFKKSPEPLPEELVSQFAANPKLDAAFHQLTPGRQRAYILFFSGAKQSATRTARIEKCTPAILAGKGLND